MSSFQHDLLLRIVKSVDAILITVPFALCWYLYYADRIASPYEHGRGDVLIVVLFLFLYVMLGQVYDAFLMSMTKVSEIIYSQALAFLISDGVMYIVICLLSKHLPNVLPGVAAICGQMLLAAVWAWGANRWYFARFPRKKTAIIYDERMGMQRLIDEYGLNKKYDVQLVIHVPDCVDHLDMLEEAGIDTVFLTDIHSHERNIILKYCAKKDIELFVIPRIGDVMMSGAHPMHMFHRAMLKTGRAKPAPEYLFIKRLMDIVISLVALIVLSPVMLGIAIAIKLEDGGPILYKQTRLTKDGREFTLLKFRSMRVDAERDGVARLSTGDNDDRITTVGKAIRRFRGDELMQLVNILRSDLSVCGPRPERPEIARQYEEEMPEFALRLQVKAGLTGYAQVYGKYNTTPYNKLQMDLMYIAHPSIVEDLKIMLATVKILFTPESTEGVEEGQETAAETEHSRPEEKHCEAVS